MASIEEQDAPAADPTHDELVDSSEQPFLDHIIELRARILRGVSIVLLLFFPIYFYANELYGIVAAPLMAHLPSDGNMIATDVASPFLTPFKLAIFAAIFLGMPFLLHQLWSFVSPGRKPHFKDVSSMESDAAQVVSRTVPSRSSARSLSFSRSSALFFLRTAASRLRFRPRLRG